MPKRKSASAVNNLVLIQSAWPSVVRGLSASNVLNLTDATDMQHKIKLASSTLVLADEALTQNILYLNAFNTLNLTHSAERQGTLNVSIKSQLDLTHDVSSALHVESVEHQLNLQQSVDVSRPINITASNNLLGGWEEVDPDLVLATDPFDTEAVAALFENIGLRQKVSLEGSVHNVSAISYLSLSQQAAKAEYASASNHIQLTQFTRTVEYEEIVSHLNFQHEVVCHKVQAVESILELDHTIIVATDFLRSASNQLVLRSIVSYVVVNFCDYTPGIGAGSFDYVPPSITAPILIRRSTTVFTWPYVNPILMLELRNPDFDNVEQFEFRRINRRTRGGTLDLYRDENWPKVQRLIYSFSQLCEEPKNQRSDLFEFLKRSIGQEIGVLDFESRQWKGVILTPSNAISEPRSNGYSVSLEIEGELVP